MDFQHIPVLLSEVIEGLSIKENGIYVDGTLGGAGHSKEIAKRLKKGKLIGIDQDINAIRKASEELKDYKDNVVIVHDNFRNIKKIINSLNIGKVDGVLLDLGVSSHQLDTAERGFSYKQDAPLDMRMDTTQRFKAWDVVNNYSKDELYKIIKEYGEEKWAKRIAEFIVEERSQKTVDTTGELVEIIKKAIPKGARKSGPHPAKRTFQAIRIEVNRELEIIRDTIIDACSLLKPGGRICIITFHSLEDKIVKNTFKELNLDCICPKELPVCQCNNRRQIKIITKKPIIPNESELESNPRARSSKLRIAEKV